MHFVYILQSTVTSKFYCGECQDIDERLLRHNSGRSKYTKHGIPWILIKLIQVDDRTCARLLEKKIKATGIQRWLLRNL